MNEKIDRSHTRIFDRIADTGDVSNLYLSGDFESPALVLCLANLPTASALNTLRNSVNFESTDDKDLFVYIYDQSVNKAYKVGKVFQRIEDIFLLEELLMRYKLQMVFKDDSGQRIVKANDFITTMRL